jgi:hypothetical protein
MFIQPLQTQDSQNNRSNELQRSVIHHVFWCSAELLVALDDLVNRIQEVLFCYCFSASTDSIHASLGADASDISSCSSK